MEILKKIKLNLPNAITCLNLFAGCISIMYAFDGELKLASLFIGIAAIFDFSDGFAARILKAFSALGKDLDSLADVVSFGLAPSVLVFKLYQKSMFIENVPIGNIEFVNLIFLCSAFLITIFSALRLAKFNVDLRQTTSFIGLPTPANAILIASIPFIITGDHDNIISNFFLNKYFLLLFIVIMCYLLISEIPMFSLKFKDLKFRNNIKQFTLIISSFVLIIFFKFAAIPVIIFLYILISIINNYIINKQ
jgi:CDP-diacylglycerol---serine O-phosphatidyltransferase